MHIKHRHFSKVVSAQAHIHMYKAGIQVKSIALETWVHCDLKKDFREGLYGLWYGLQWNEGKSSYLITLLVTSKKTHNNVVIGGLIKTKNRGVSVLQIPPPQVQYHNWPVDDSNSIVFFKCSMHCIPVCIFKLCATNTYFWINYINKLRITVTLQEQLTLNLQPSTHKFKWTHVSTL